MIYSATTKLGLLKKNRYPPPLGPQFLPKLTSVLMNRRARWNQIQLPTMQVKQEIMYEAMEMQMLGIPKQMVLRAWYRSNNRDPHQKIGEQIIHLVNKSQLYMRSPLNIDDQTRHRLDFDFGASR